MVKNLNHVEHGNQSLAGVGLQMVLSVLRFGASLKDQGGVTPRTALGATRQEHLQHALERCRGMVAQHRDLPVALRGQPIELNDPALFFAPAYSNKSDLASCRVG
jgi:hypothetical protein